MNSGEEHGFQQGPKWHARMAALIVEVRFLAMPRKTYQHCEA
jgi:hypothetical protein